MSSTELFDAASISTTSSEVPEAMARAVGVSGSKSARGPPSALRAEARSFAIDVFPVPREPTNRYAWWTLSSSIAFRSVLTMCSCPTTESNVRGRWRR
jgi:hypothetical protein